jgi:hypothetical protein
MTGKDIIIVLTHNNVAIASTCVKSNDIQVQADILEKASSTQQLWKEYISGRKGWTINVSYLVLSAAKLLDVLLTGDVLGITVKDSANTYSYSGQCLLETTKQTYTVGNLAQGSFVLRGTGALSYTQPT